MKANKIIKDLLIKLLLGHLTETEHKELANNADVKAMMFQQWENNSDIKAKTETPDYKRIFDKIIVGAGKGLKKYSINELKEYKEKYRKLQKSYLIFSRVAAVLMIAFFAAAGLYIANSVKEISYSEVISPRGQKSKIILEDGTVAWLNSGSTISYSRKFNKRNREIELIGEAFFDVFKKERRPFVVNTPCLSVQALGTKFNLMAYPEDASVQTTLVEGRIQIQSKDEKTISLSPNQKAIYNKADNNFSIEIADPIYSISWKDNVLKFNDKSLPDILTHLERWYDVKFYYPENVLDNERFTMTIKTESLREVLELVKISTPIKFEIEVDSVYITLINYLD